MINRTAVLLRYKAAAIKWLNEVELREGNKNLTTKENIKKNDRNVYLIKDDPDFAPESIYEWCEKNYKTLFVMELKDWYLDKKLWPKELTYEIFRKWFDVEWHSTIIDMEEGHGEPIVDDGFYN